MERGLKVGELCATRCMDRLSLDRFPVTGEGKRGMADLLSLWSWEAAVPDLDKAMSGLRAHMMALRLYAAAVTFSQPNVPPVAHFQRSNSTIFKQSSSRFNLT